MIRVTSLVCVLLAGTCLMAGPAWAQSGEHAPDQAAPETTPATDAGTTTDADIVVTARRRNERLQDVPVAVSVVSGDALARQNMQSMTDFQRFVPSLTVTPSSGRANSANFMVRGQRQTDNTIFADPSVQLYINEVNAARTSGLDSTAFDLESVQVLKGPQGTLFGRNSTGGAVLITTRKPGDHFGGYLKTYIEDPLGTGVEGAIDLPLAQGVVLRVAGNYNYRQGYTYVVNTGQHLDDKNRWVARATLDLKPFDGFRSTFVGELFNSNENGLGTYSFLYSPGYSGNAVVTGAVKALGYPAAYAQAQALDYHETTSSVLGLSRYRTYSLTNTTSFDVSPSLTLKNIVGWRKVKGHDIIDQDGTVANIIVNDGWNGAIQFSEEFQLQGKMFDNNLEWVAGGYYFKESGYDNVHTFTFKTPLVGSYTNNYYLGRNESLSAFAHLSYTLPFATRTRIFGGVRYTHDRREIDFRNRSVSATGSVTCTVVGATNSNCSLVKSVTFNEPTWDVGIDRKVGSDSLVYASVSTGYRAGGFNGRATSVASQQPFKPEKVVNYEIGSKNQFILGGAPVTVNLAAYYSDYKDIQRTVVLNGAPVGAPPVVVTSIVNAATARIWGVEGEFVVRPSPSFNANAHFSYTNARYQKFGTFDAATGTELDISNNRFMGVPPVQWGLGVNWIPMDADNGKLTLGSDISFTDKFDMNDINVPRGTTNAVGLVNANINWDNLLGSKLSASIYVKNLFDTHYISSGLLLTSALDVSQVQHGAPRVVGAMLRLNF